MGFTIHKRPDIFGRVYQAAKLPEWMYDPKWTGLLSTMIKMFLEQHPELTPVPCIPACCCCVPGGPSCDEHKVPPAPAPTFINKINQNDPCSNVETFHFQQQDCGFSVYEINIPQCVNHFMVTMVGGGSAGTSSIADSNIISGGNGGGGGASIINYPIDTTKYTSPYYIYVGQGGTPDSIANCDHMPVPLINNLPTIPGQGFPSFIVDADHKIIAQVDGGTKEGGNGPFPGTPGEPPTNLRPSVHSRAQIESTSGGFGGSSIFHVGGIPGTGDQDGFDGYMGSGGGGAGTGFFKKGGAGGHGVVIVHW